MSTILNFLEHFAATFWFGTILCFSFLVAPTFLGALGEKEAGRAVRAIFPRYYLVGIGCGVALTAVHVARGVLYYWGGMTVPMLVLVVGLTLIQIYARQVLTPAVNRARDAGAEGKAAFDKLHRRSVQWNVFTLVCGMGYLYWVAVRGY